MSFKLYFLILTCSLLIGASSADIFGDFFKWGLNPFSEDDSAEKQAKQEDEESSASKCNCNGPTCNCCVDFNISDIIDLGGPGCVVMRYLSASDGISVNVSYGSQVLHSQKVVDEKKQGACMPLLSDLAQFCARFSDLTRVDDQMTGCLNFEPTVFGEATTQYFVGCFRMSPDSMILDNSLNSVTEDDDSKEEQETSTKKPNEGNQSFLEVVNQSAQESFEFLSNLLGINSGTKKKNKNKENEKESEASTESVRTE